MLSERVQKARNIVKAGLVHQVGERAWLVPGTDGKKYLVTRRKGKLRYRCELDLGGHGLNWCKGNSISAMSGCHNEPLYSLNSA